MSSSSIVWPCGEKPFAETVRGRFYRRLLRTERAAWLGLVVIPCVTWALRAPPEGSWPAVEWIVVMGVAFAGTWWTGRRFLTKHLIESLRRGERETATWRRAFAEVVTRTAALVSSIPSADRSRDPILRGSALAAVDSKLHYVYSLSAPVDVSFSPRHFAGGPVQAKRLRSTLEGQLVLELLRTGTVTALFKDQGGNLIALSQLDSVIQFWAIIRVEPVGNEIRVSERTGYQWWIPWSSWTRTLGLPMRGRLMRVESFLTEGVGPWWPLSSSISKTERVAVCLALAFVLFPIGLALWGARVFLRARRLKSFLTWHDPSAGDSLDLALLGNERRMRLATYVKWQLETMENADGTLSFPDIVGRIDVMRELVGAAVSQAIEETLNSSSDERHLRHVAS